MMGNEKLIMSKSHVLWKILQPLATIFDFLSLAFVVPLSS